MIRVSFQINQMKMLTGKRVGCSVGYAVGRFVGVFVGRGVGCSVGDSVIGASDGASVGCLDGRFVGVLVGLLLGSLVGRGVTGGNVGFGVGCSVGLSVIGKHVVYAKQLSPDGQVLLFPDGHGRVHDWEALSKVWPQKKEPGLAHGVKGKHFKFPGQSSSVFFGHGIAQLSDASS